MGLPPPPLPQENTHTHMHTHPPAVLFSSVPCSVFFLKHPAHCMLHPTTRLSSPSRGLWRPSCNASVCFPTPLSPACFGASAHRMSPLRCPCHLPVARSGLRCCCPSLGCEVGSSGGCLTFLPQCPRRSGSWAPPTRRRRPRPPGTASAALWRRWARLHKCMRLRRRSWSLPACP
jgi:hypothetical protein